MYTVCSTHQQLHNQHNVIFLSENFKSIIWNTVCNHTLEGKIMKSLR